MFPSFSPLLQRGQTQSPPPIKPPSPSFELGLSSFPPLPGAAGNLKPEDFFENRLSNLVISTSKDKVRSASMLAEWRGRVGRVYRYRWWTHCSHLRCDVHYKLKPGCHARSTTQPTILTGCIVVCRVPPVSTLLIRNISAALFFFFFSPIQIY